MAFDLTQLDADFAAATPPEQKNDEIPNGKQNVKVEKVEIREAKASGRPYLNWTLKILDGPFANRCIWHRSNMATKENMSWLKKDLATCGIKIEKASDLPAVLKDLLDKRLAVTVKNKVSKDGGTIQNIYLDKLLKDESGNQDIPF